MTTVTVAGQELHVVDRGNGDPVVFLHAFPFNAAMWEYQYAALEADRRVIGIDLPGFGSSPAPTDPKAATMEGWADLVAGVFDELGLDQPVIVAASMGGYLTFELIRRHLDKLGPLVLVATRAKSDDVDTWEKRTAQQQALEGGEDLATLAKGMVEGLLSQGSLDRPELVEYVLALMQHNLPEGWIAAPRRHGRAAGHAPHDPRGRRRARPHHPAGRVHAHHPSRGRRRAGGRQGQLAPAQPREPGGVQRGAAALPDRSRRCGGRRGRARRRDHRRCG
jgi:pimeloyl-ACP methyl ester carboxylesterase